MRFRTNKSMGKAANRSAHQTRIGNSISALHVPGAKVFLAVELSKRAKDRRGRLRPHGLRAKAQTEFGPGVVLGLQARRLLLRAIGRTDDSNLWRNVRRRIRRGWDGRSRRMPPENVRAKSCIRE